MVDSFWLQNPAVMVQPLAAWPTIVNLPLERFADGSDLRLGTEWEMGLSASMSAPFARLGRRTAAQAGLPDWRTSIPATIGLILFLAGCAGPTLPNVGDRQPSLRVADAALAVGAPEIALRVADLALARDPRSTEALVTKGDAFYAMGLREEAGAAYRQALSLDPKLAVAQLGLGRTLVQVNPGAAEAAFLAAVAARPDNSAALNNLGIARDLLGHHAEAQEAYRAALAIAPEAADVKANLGLSLVLTGDKGAAVEVLREAAAAPAAVRERGTELAAALALAGDEAYAHKVLAASQIQPMVGNAASASADMPSSPAAANRGGPVAVEPKQAGSARVAVAPRPAPPSQPPDVPSPPPVVSAPVVAVAHTSLTSLLPEAASEELVDTAALPAQPRVAQPATATKATPAELTPDTGAFVQLASLHSLDDAWYEWRRLRRLFPMLLDGHAPVIVQADALGQAYWCLRTFGFVDLAAATAMCSEAHGSSGLRCWARLAS